jgi:4-diphosphocytidyl-2-C-methyl-D-erythritol kinase
VRSGSSRRHAGRGVRIEARAKLNLGLAIGPRREDGYHELATVFQSISLADTLVVEPRTRGFSLAIRYQDVSAPRGAATGALGRLRRPRTGAERVPAGPANLVLRAARLLADQYGLPGGAVFTLTKRIPAGTGLGGGSADAAAALVGLARLHGLRWSLRDRLAIGAELGSDVPFALLGGTALGLGRGERLRRLRLVAPFRAVLAVPRWRVGTARAFRALDRGKYGLTRWSLNLRFAEALGRKAVRPKDALRLGNAFEKVLGGRRSGFLSLCARLRHAGVEEPHLTGSGSAVFGILPTRLTAARFVDRFAGDEAIYLIRSRGTGLTHHTLR